MKSELAYSLLIAQQGQEPSTLGLFVPMVLMIIIFYFLLIRPQQKKAKEHTTMVEKLKNGDRVETNGGIVGVVQSVKEHTLSVRSLDSKFELNKSAVSRVIESTSSHNNS